MVDTSGLEPFAPSGCIQHRATELTTRVLRRADIMLLLLDGRYVDTVEALLMPLPFFFRSLYICGLLFSLDSKGST